VNSPYRDLEAIFRAGLSRVDPARLVRSSLHLRDGRLTVGTGADLRSYDLDAYRRIVVLGAGKASARMAQAVEEILGARITSGLVTVKHGYGVALRRCTLMEAGHPVPDEGSLRAAALTVEAARDTDETCLVIGLYSGGASSLLCLPDGLSLSDKRATTRALLSSGATIHEMNCVRKHLSRIKGGWLASHLHPADTVNLVLSDVVGDDLDVIGSGLTSPDRSTYADALGVLGARGLEGLVPPAALTSLRAGAAGSRPETPKPGDPVFLRCHNVIVGSNRICALAAAERARGLGYTTLVLTTRLEGEAREAARLFLALGRDSAATGIPLPPPACILCGGETTVTVRGAGSGGRNQELALAYLAGLRDAEHDRRAYLLAASTDGTDGPTDAAGAFASWEIRAEAQARGLDPATYLANNDSYAFFRHLGRHLRTGPTHTNVCDLQVLLVR
jgi:hydroxypyruvate reductase